MIAVVVTREAPERGLHRMRPGLLAAASAWLLVVVAAVGALGAPAGADATVQGTVSMATRSVTVDTTSVAYDDCEISPYATADASQSTAGLPTPNGVCSTSDTFTVTNGQIPDWIEVSTGRFEPDSTVGPPWDICNFTGGSFTTAIGDLTCSGTAFSGGQLPGQNQAEVQLVSSGDNAPIGPYPRCAGTIDPAGCTTTQGAAAGASGTFGLDMTGPQSVQSTSPSFSDAITWTAVPPS